MGKKKYINLREKSIPYLRVMAHAEGGKVVSAMLQEWDQETQQWKDIRPLQVQEDGTVVYSTVPERQVE